MNMRTRRPRGKSRITLILILCALVLGAAIWLFASSQPKSGIAGVWISTEAAEGVYGVNEFTVQGGISLCGARALTPDSSPENWGDSEKWQCGERTRGTYTLDGDILTVQMSGEVHNYTVSFDTENKMTIKYIGGDWEYSYVRAAS